MLSLRHKYNLINNVNIYTPDNQWKQQQYSLLYQHFAAMA